MKGMFVLRQQHEDAFGEAGLHRFAKKAVRMLRQDHPDAVKRESNETLLNLVKPWMEFARRSNLKTERQMYWFIESGIFLRNRGESIRHNSTVRDILSLSLIHI